MRNLSRPVHLNAPGGQMGEGGRLQHQRFHILDPYLGGKICFRTFISPNIKYIKYIISSESYILHNLGKILISPQVPRQHGVP